MASAGLELDDLDRRILAELQEDGRRPFREIARQAGVSERTIRARVKRMQDAGVLRILAFADPFQLGHQVLAFALLRVDASAHDRIVETISTWREASYVSSLMGRWDVYVQLVCLDNERLWDLVNHRIRGLDGVLETETTIEMRVHRFTYTYPLLVPGAEGADEP